MRNALQKVIYAPILDIDKYNIEFLENRSEDMLRTYMDNGTDPEELEKLAKETKSLRAEMDRELSALTNIVEPTFVTKPWWRPGF